MGLKHCLVQLMPTHIRVDDFKTLADRHLTAAESLSRDRLWTMVFYHCGYVIECELKALCLHQLLSIRIPFEPKSLNKYGDRFYTHNFADLVELAGVKSDLEAKQALDPTFAAN